MSVSMHGAMECSSGSNGDMDDAEPGEYPSYTEDRSSNEKSIKSIPHLHPTRAVLLANAVARDANTVNARARQDVENGASRSAHERDFEKSFAPLPDNRTGGRRRDRIVYPDNYVPSYSYRRRSRSRIGANNSLQQGRQTSADTFSGVSEVERGFSFITSAMADMEAGYDRGDDRRGGGDRGGRNRGNKRRRDGELEASKRIRGEADAHIADENDDYHYTPRNDGRGPQRRRRDDSGRGPRGGGYVEPPPAKLRRILLNIASSTKLPEDEAIEIAEYLRDNYDEEEARNEFFDVLVLLFVPLFFWY